MARYVLERRIGEGGMAEVFRAKAEGDSGFERVVAVKRLLPALAKDPKLQARFIDEARISGRLRHPNVVGVSDFYQDGGVSHLVMEFVDGVSAEHLVLRGFAGKFVPPAVAARIALDAARAIEYAHGQAVLHRDVSACNILVSRDGEVKLADFGLADARERVSSTEPGEIAGKAPYLSPERKAGEAATTLDDLFALGVVIERLLEAMDPRDRSTATARALASAAAKLALPRNDRTPSAAALVAELRGSDPAEAAAVAELVKNNPQVRPGASRERLSAGDLDETTRSSQGGHDDATVVEPRPRLRAAIIGAVAAVVVLAAVALLTAP